MTRALRLLLGASALALLSSCASGPLPYASCRFTPPGPRSTEALQLVSSDRGLGGSGIGTEDRGLGGSGIRAGIIGVVTGFGSLCVNGYEVELDESSVVTLEGHPATEADIHLGQLVVIEADQEDGKLRAASVDVRLAAMGPVSTVSADGKTLTVLGQTVRLVEMAEAAEKVVPGDWVAVSGLRDANAVIEGTSVVRLPRAGTYAMVAGVVREGRVAGLDIGTQSASPGDAVVVDMRPADGRFTVASVRPQTEARFTAGVRDVSVQTFVPEVRPVGGLPVQLEGRLVAGNTFIPNRVTIPALPRDGQFAVRNILMDRDTIFRGVVPSGPVIPALVPPTPPTETRPPVPPPAP
ncbi:MAG: DUF5666 domain-containing protein [Proteobacteria bacterium]|nr:DUF5666 domain-containing protein [Pseudomonadota bacterium]